MTVIAQVCLFLKIEYCWSRLWRTVPGMSRKAKTVAAITRGRTIHLLSSSPAPPALSGSNSHSPTAAVISPIASMPRILPKAANVEPRPGETCSAVILFMPNHAAITSGIRMATQM